MLHRTNFSPGEKVLPVDFWGERCGRLVSSGADAGPVVDFDLRGVYVKDHQPILTMGKPNKAVQMYEEGWAASQATLYLLAAPGTRESIGAGLDVGEDGELTTWKLV